MKRFHSSDQRRLVRDIKANGFDVVFGGKHLAVVNSDGKRVYTMPVTGSDRRGLLNTRAGLRRAGVLA